MPFPGITAAEIAYMIKGARPAGNGYRAPCPAHDSHNPDALHFFDDPSGKGVVFQCFTGPDCSIADITGTLGIESTPKAPPNPAGGQTVYDYTDAEGNLSFQVVRSYRNGKKTFLQRRPDGATPGEYIWNMQGVERVLYRLPRVLEAVQAGQTILILEGEKDVLAAEQLGFIATTNSGGAGKWLPAHSETLRGAHVVNLPDNDDAGRKHASQVARSLQGVAASIRVVELPGLLDKGDLADWLEAGGTREELQALIDAAEAVNELIETTKASPVAGMQTKRSGIPYQASATGKIRESQANYEIMLSHEREWKGRLAYNSFQQAIEFDGHSITSADRAAISSWASHELSVTGTALKIRDQAVAVVAAGNTYDPLADFVNNLPAWDGVPRLSNMLHTYCGADDSPIVKWISRMMIVQMIARALNPGCMARYCVVLEGKEEVGKSEVVRALGDKWYVSLTGSLDSKEAAMSIRGSWTVEIEEMSSIKRSTRERVKHFVSARVDYVVPKYSNDREAYPRRCVFVGTTNDRDYLPSETGDGSNTRWFPVPTTCARVDELKRDRAQIMVEARDYYMLHQDDWWVIPDEIKSPLADARRDRLEDNTYEGKIAQWLDAEDKSETYWEELAADCLGLPVEKWTRLIQMQAMDALKRMGWTKGNRKRNSAGIRIVPWYAPMPAEEGCPYLSIPVDTRMDSISCRV